MPSASSNGSQRELGQFFQEIVELRHDVRNVRQVLDSIDGENRRFDRELIELRAEIAQFRGRLTTGIAVGVALASAGAWAIEMWIVS